MPEHRLRMTDVEITFILDRLKELQEGYDEMVPEYRRWRKQHRNDLVREAGSEYSRATDAYYQTNRKSLANRDMIRRLECILAGGRPRTTNIGTISMMWVHDDKVKLDAEVEAREASKIQNPPAKPESKVAFKLQIDGEAKKEV